MPQTNEAVHEPDGRLRFLEKPPAPLTATRRVLVTFTEEPQTAESNLCGLRLSEPVLAREWTNEEEDAAWAHLQAGR